MSDFSSMANIASFWKMIAHSALHDLEKIAKTDYRGNKSPESDMASKSVERIKKMMEKAS